MAHHKRGRTKDRRAGCLMCKGHKSNGNKGSLGHQTLQERKGRFSAAEQVGAAQAVDVLGDRVFTGDDDFWDYFEDWGAEDADALYEATLPNPPLTVDLLSIARFT